MSDGIWGSATASAAYAGPSFSQMTSFPLSSLPHSNSGSHSPEYEEMPPPNGSSSSRKKRASVIDDDDKPKKKRNRQALSCTECKRRKIKCDRKIPCEACIKRNESAGCHWEDTTKVVPPQIFATLSDIEEMRHRLARVESVLGGLAPDAFTSIASTGMISPATNSSTHDLRTAKETTTPEVVAPPPRPASYPNTMGDIDSDTEEAANVLEGLATTQNIKTEDNGHHMVKHILDMYGSKNPFGLAMAPQLDREQSTILRHPEPDYPALEGVQLHPFLQANTVSGILRTIECILPDPLLSQTLIDMYFATWHWNTRIHFKTSFLREHQEYLHLLSTGNLISYVDPAWMALYFITISLTCNRLSDPIGNLSREDLKQLPTIYYEAAMLCMKAADWAVKPCVRTIQTLLLSGPFTKRETDGATLLIFVAAAARLGQAMGLDKLCDDDTMPFDDLAWPTGKNGMKRELGRRLWHQIVFADWMNTPSPVIRWDSFTTLPPSNCNDDEISLDIKVPNHPTVVLRESTFEILKIRLCQSQYLLRVDIDEARAKSNGVLPYDKLLGHDKTWRTSTADMPPEYRHPPLNGESEPKEMAMLRNMIVSGFSNRLLRLHRPYMTRGYRNRAYEYSTRTCLESARGIVNAQKNLNKNQSQHQYHHKLWFIFRHLMGAALVFIIALLHGDRDPTLIPNIEYILEIFQSSISNPNHNISQFAKTGTACIRQLLDVCQSRHNIGGQGQQNGESESIASVLKRVATAVEAASIAQVSPSMSTNGSTGHSLNTPSSHQSDQDLLATALNTDKETMALFESIGMTHLMDPTFQNDDNPYGGLWLPQESMDFSGTTMW